MNKQLLSLIFFSLFLSFYSQDVPPCVTNPDKVECVDYKLPARGYVDELCGMMWMPGCTIDKICKNKEFNDSKTSNTFCSDFSVMVDICDDMTMGVKGCEYFKQMCRNENVTSVVKQCKTPILSHVLPTTKETKNLVANICAEMPMHGCNKCKAGDMNCDYLEVYSDLCLQMRDMKQCAQWKELCKVVPNFPICNSANNPNAPPEMRMYFHFGLKDYILFKNWVPTSTGYYFGSWIAIFAMSLFYDVIKFVRLKLERKWAENSSYMKINTNDHNKLDESSEVHENRNSFKIQVEIPRAFLQAIEMTWGYFLMLIAMTYNVGLFGAVIAGTFVGSLLFGRFVGYQPKVSCH